MNNQKSDIVLEMRGITKRFPGVIANDQVDLQLYSGEVLGLLGENGAGKSTLMNVLIGLYREDEGDIFIRGEHVEITSPNDAAALGIGMVHQNFKLVRTMTVTENIILGLKHLSFVPDTQKVAEKIIELSERYHLQVDPKAYIWQLSVGERQRVEILKLLYRGAEILVLDEPTAVLTPQEAQELDSVLDIMTSEGKSAVFITHKMDEVMDFSDRVLVLRKGRVEATRVTSETSPKELARLMVGRDVLFRLDKEPFSPGHKVLELKNIHIQDERGLPALTDVSLAIRSGEIVGIAGVAGNGQGHLAEVITGMKKPNQGKKFLNGKEVTNHSPLALIRDGVSHIPADRIGMGVVGNMPVADNLSMKGYRKEPISSKGILRPNRIIEYAKSMIERFQIMTPNPKTLVKFLSGGNIQKTILAREIDACNGLMVAVYPSRGLDVGATENVREMLIKQREKGLAVLLISEDLGELMSLSDRIAVLYEGQIMGVVSAEEADRDMLGLMMAGTRINKLPEDLSVETFVDKD